MATKQEEEAAAKAAAELKAKEEEAAELAKAEAAARAKRVKSGSVTVTWNGGERTYSKDIHGAEFHDLADQFAAKFKGTIA